jgi:predicted RNase H-like nuclease (RuvC/YqgF family)
MQKVHDHTAEMGAECKCNKCNETKKGDPESDLAKSMTKALLAKVQAIHDHTNELGVECKCAKCQKSDGKEDDEMDMKKIEELTKRQDALEAENKTLKADNEALKKRVEDLEKMPEPAKGAKLDAAAITKQDDSKIDLTKGDQKIEEKDPVAMMKKAHSEPQIYSLHKPL